MDLTTLQIVTAGNAAMFGILSAALAYLWRLEPAHRAPAYWAAGLFIMAVRQALILAEPGTLPPPTVVAILVAALPFLLFFAGAREFVGTPLRARDLWGLGAVVAALAVLPSLTSLPRHVALAPLVAVVVGLSVLAAFVFYRGDQRPPQARYPVLGTLFVVTSVAVALYPFYAESPTMRVVYAVPTLLAVLAAAISLIIATQRRQHLRTVSAREDAEAANQRFQDVVDTATAWIWEMDTERRLTYVSPQVQGTLGIAPEAFIGRRFRDVPGLKVVEPDAEHAAELFRPDRRIYDVRYRVETESGKTIHISIRAKPIFDRRGVHVGFRGLCFDVTESVRAQALLDAVTAAIADSVGTDYLRQLVRRLAADLGVDHAFVGLLEDGHRIRTLASYGDGAHQPDMEYALAGTPCAGTLTAGKALVHRDTARLFPEDALLAELRVEGYAGRALRNAAGELIGLVAIMSRAPLRDPETVETVLAAVAPRAGAELGRQIAETALRDSEALFRTVIDHMPIGFHLTDMQGRFVMRNHMIDEWSGISRSDVLGRTHREVAERLPYDYAQVEADLRAVVSSRRPVSNERTNRHPDGRKQHLLIWRYPVLDAAGNVRYVASLLTDLTQVRQLEQEVRDNEALFRAVIDHMPLGFQLTDTDGRIILVNRMLERWTEPDWRPVVGERLSDLIVRNPKLVNVEAECREVVATRQPVIRERQHQMGDGSERSVLVCRYPLLDQAGEVRYVASLLTDLTDSKRLEQQVRQSEALLRAVIDNMPSGFHLKDADGRFLIVNRTLEQWFVRDRHAILGRTPDDVAGLFPALNVAKSNQEHEEVLRTGQPFMRERAITTEDGARRHVIVSRFPILDPSGHVAQVAAMFTDITELRQMEQQVRQSEALLRALIDNMPVGFLLCDAQGRIVRRNPILESWSRRDNTGVIGGLPGDAEILGELRSVVESRQPLIRERTLPVDGGQSRPVLVCRVPILDPSGEVSFVATLVTDLTDIKRMESQVQASEALLRAIIENMPIGFQLTDAEGRILMLNPPIDRWTVPELRPRLGETLAEGTRRNPRLAQAEAECREVVATGRPLMRERTLLGGEGREMPVLILRFPIFGDGGRVAYTGSLITDMSSIRQLENEILLSEARLQRIVSALDRSGKGIVVEDSARRPLYVNLTAEALLGPAPSAASILEQAGVVDEVPPGGTWSGEVIHPTPTGRDAILEMSAARLPDGSLVTVLDDVTERLERERRQTELERQVQEAQKIDAVGQLAGGIAHDFNNLIGAILGFARFIVEDTPADGRVHGYAQRILSASQRGRELIQQILALARREEAPRNTVALTPIVEESAQMLRATLPASHRIEIRNLAPDIWLNANATQLTQILVNLCLNADDALGTERGTITLTLEQVAPDDPLLRRLVAAEPASRPQIEPARPPGTAHRCYVGSLAGGRRYVRLSVRDDGPGIPPDILGRLFEPFFTTKPRGKGTGLGLPVVQKLVLAHEGAIMITTAPGAGTTFDIFLPGVEPPDRVEPAAPVAAALPAGGRGRVLVVDDDVDFGDMVSTAIDRAGYEVAVCASPREAVDIFRESPDAWDVLITDQTMPEISGLELIARLRALQPELRCVLCTGYASSGLDEAKARAGGADSFFHKPVETTDIVACVAGHLAARGKSAAAQPPR